MDYFLLPQQKCFLKKEKNGRPSICSVFTSRPAQFG